MQAHSAISTRRASKWALQGICIDPARASSVSAKGRLLGHILFKNEDSNGVWRVGAHVKVLLRGDAHIGMFSPQDIKDWAASLCTLVAWLVQATSPAFRD